MKLLSLAFVLFALSSCGPDKPTAAVSPSADTIRTKGFTLLFKEADSAATADIYGDLPQRKKITNILYNTHEKARAIEAYLAPISADQFSANDSSIILFLANERKITFPKWDGKLKIGYNFEHYFASINYYLLHVQEVEGQSWLLVNRSTGNKYPLSGLPYISPDKTRLITISEDLESGFSFNGMELYTIYKDSIHREFQIQPIAWGPAEARWINNKQLLLKEVYFNEYGYFDRRYRMMEITKAK